jgi:hypothetical protein
LISAGVGLSAFLVYRRTLAPGLTWAHNGADGGDLATAVLTGGIPHPHGYPTYLWVAGLFARLPIGEPILRMNLFSAVSAALAAALVAWTAVHLTGGRERWLAGWVAGLGLALSPLLWSQAVITEVYSLAAFFVALLVWLASVAPSGLWNSAALGWVVASAFGAHASLALVSPMALARMGKVGRAHWAAFSLGLVLGLVPFAWLIARARGDAPMYWGLPEDLEGWWWLVSARLYQARVFGMAAEDLPPRLLAWLALLKDQFTPLGVPILLAGVARGWRRHRRLTITSLLSTLLLTAFAWGYAAPDSYLLLIPVNVLMAPFLGMGLVGLVEAWARGPLPGRAAVGLGLALLLWQVVWHGPAMDLSGDRSAQEFAQRAMLEAPQGALLISATDAHTFSLWYVHHALGVRPDVTIVDRDLWAMDWYRAQLAADLPATPDLELALQASGRPICAIQAEGLLQCR